MSTLAFANKSTIVRIIMSAAQVPWLGDLWLSERFLRAPPRLRAEEVEQRVLASAESRTLRTRSHRLQSFHWGQGPRVLLVHGHGGAASQLTPFVRPLVEAGYSVIAYDAPGHGHSPGRHASLVSMARALREVLDEVGPVHAVIAHSLGAAATCLAAKQGARIPRAVLVAPPSNVQHWYERFVRGLALSPEQAERVKRVIERRLSTAMRELHADLLGPHLHAETLVIHDRNDREVAHDSGAHVARSIAGARFVSTEGLGHRRILKDKGVIAMTLAFASQTQVGSALARVIDDELFHPEHRTYTVSTQPSV